MLRVHQHRGAHQLAHLAIFSREHHVLASEHLPAQAYALVRHVASVPPEQKGLETSLEGVHLVAPVDACQQGTAISDRFGQERGARVRRTADPHGVASRLTRRPRDQHRSHQRGIVTVARQHLIKGVLFDRGVPEVSGQHVVGQALGPKHVAADVPEQAGQFHLTPVPFRKVTVF